MGKPMQPAPHSNFGMRGRMSHVKMRGGAAAPTWPVYFPKHAVISALLIGLWYASSVVNNQSSKVLVSAIGPNAVTLVQLLVSACCGALALLLSNGRESRLTKCGFMFASRDHLVDTAQLAAAFLAGVHSLNTCLSLMHVSLAMVLRAAEPLTTLALSALMLPASEQPPQRKMLALLPVVLGCSLSAVGAHGPTAKAFMLVGISNVCFSLRAILGKRVKARHGAGAVVLLFQLCVLGGTMQAALMLLRAVLSRVVPLHMLIPSALAAVAAQPLALLLLCGASFFSQLQLSFVCLGRMSAVSHSLANSMRRPATIAAALLFAPAPLTVVNWVGIAMACSGALIYGLL